MKHMKLVTTTLALICALSLAGCGSSNSGQAAKMNRLLTIKPKINLTVRTQIHPMKPRQIWTTCWKQSF